MRSTPHARHGPGDRLVASAVLASVVMGFAATTAVSPATDGPERPSRSGERSEPRPTKTAPIVLIGGALRADNADVHRAVLSRRKGDGPLCIIPTATRRSRAAIRAYTRDFRRYTNHHDLYGIPLEYDRPARAEDDDVARRLETCGGFFFTGGDTARVAAVLRPDGVDSRAMAILRRKFEEGAVVAGTSAGAAVLPGRAIAGGVSAIALGEDAADEPGSGRLWLIDGLGLLPGAVVDQHFWNRARFGRFAVASWTLGFVGIGVAEDTAAVIERGAISAVGNSRVAVFAPTPTEPAATARRGRLWLLADGDRLDLETLAFTPAGDKRPAPEVDEDVPDYGEPWIGDVVHRRLAALALAKREAIRIEDEAGVLTFAKGAGFVSRWRGTGDTDVVPPGLGAGPFEITWTPAANP